ncbi:MAG: hypothetical protein F6K30_30490 [Cyanothece sp. SIO2G6]|nr:hypothetical protein [Cyanothece sp. SIO2G6]
MTIELSTNEINKRVVRKTIYSNFIPWARSDRPVRQDWDAQNLSGLGAIAIHP